MIIILNGSIGVGKTSVSWALQAHFAPSVMLDGDYIGAVYPFNIYDKSRIDYLYQTFVYLIQFHLNNGYEHFIVNYVFEKAENLALLQQSLEDLGQEVVCFWLTCEEQEQLARIQKRNNDQVDWDINRAKELNQILEAESQNGFIGQKIDTSGKSIVAVVDYIYQIILKQSDN